MFSSRLAVTVAVLTMAAGNAHALKPGKHAKITRESCKAAGLPRDFCERAATEDFNTDWHEWKDLRAHAQISDGQTACEAANATAGRLWQLGAELRTSLAAVASRPTETNVGKAATALGRALHTIQDDCAHHGMPNPQHAWFSMEDFCDGTELSPDVQEDAATCAETETDAVMQYVAHTIGTGLNRPLGAYACPDEPGPGGGRHGNDRTVCDHKSLPGPISACSFLAEAKNWDGIDRTWDNNVVAPALRDAFFAGLDGVHATADICDGNEGALARPMSEPTVDVSEGPAKCFRASLFCFGKADGEVENPFAEEPDPAEVGCSVGGSGNGLALAGGMLLVALRRRRRR